MLLYINHNERISIFIVFGLVLCQTLCSTYANCSNALQLRKLRKIKNVVRKLDLVGSVLRVICNILTLITSSWIAVIFLSHQDNLYNSGDFFYALTPLYLGYILKMIAYFCEKPETETECVYKIVICVIKASMLILMTNAAFILDGRVKWSWDNAFWPFWVLSALYFGATVISLISLLWRAISLILGCVPQREKKNLKKEVLCSLWITLNIAGFSLGSVVVVHYTE